MKNYICPQRFDLMAKYLYIKYIDQNIKTDFFKNLYHSHILTFNNCIEFADLTKNEKGNSKNNINDFVLSFNNLITDMIR